MTHINGNEFMKEFIHEIHKKRCNLKLIAIDNCITDCEKSSRIMDRDDELAWVQHKLLELMRKYEILEE